MEHDGSVSGRPPGNGGANGQNSPPASPSGRPRAGSSAASRLRTASFKKFIDSDMPLGFSAATGTAAARAPSLSELRRYSGNSQRQSISSQTRNGESTPSVPAETSRSGNAYGGGDAVRGSQSGKAGRQNDETDDGFPANIFGRGEIDGQSYVRGQRNSVSSGRVPKLRVRDRESDGDISNTEGERHETQSGPSTESTSRPTNNVNRTGSSESFADIDEDEDELDDFYPKPKRSSKNIDAMLGRGPEKPPTALTTLPSRDEEADDLSPKVTGPDADGVYPTGYTFPPKKTWGQATMLGTKAFLRFTFTPIGFFVVLYGLNVVAWGGMLFLLLCNASPAMCQLGNGGYDCNDIDSPRRVWVEIDSQVVNALFCVTGFGLIPWRFRDFYYLLKWRFGKDESSLRKLAGYHSSWFRLPGSEKLPLHANVTSDEYATNAAVPLPLTKAPAAPLTGVRARSTPLWKLDYVIWLFVWNTFLQACLSGVMWGLNRYNRPGWTTGFLVAIACIVAAAAGLMQFFEGKKIKKVEGIPFDTMQTLQDVEKHAHHGGRSLPADNIQEIGTEKGKSGSAA